MNPEQPTLFEEQVPSRRREAEDKPYRNLKGDLLPWEELKGGEEE